MRQSRSRTACLGEWQASARACCGDCPPGGASVARRCSARLASSRRRPSRARSATGPHAGALARRARRPLDAGGEGADRHAHVRWLSARPSARPRDDRAAAPRLRDVSPRRSASQVRHRVDGALARAPPAAPRPARRRARPFAARPSQANRPHRQGGAAPSLRRRAPAAGRVAWQGRVRASARRVVPRRAADVRSRASPRRARARARLVPAGGDRTAPRRPCRRARRQRSPPVDADHARAVAARARRGGGRRRVKVVHVHRMRGIGGSERHLLTLLPALAARGLDPVFVGLDDPEWDPRDFYDALRVPAVRLAAPRDVDPLLLARLVRGLRADVVHTHLVHADLYGGLAARLRGATLVSTKHNDDPFRTGAFRFVERGLSRLADRVVTISDSLRRFTIERVGVPAAKVETIHYGLDEPPRPWGANPPDGVPPNARVLLSVSRLTQQKGIDVAVRALAQLPEDMVLVVLGEGP